MVGDSFPKIQQCSAHDCGYTCVNILAIHYGLAPLALPTLATHVSIREVADFATKVGFQSYAFRTSYSWLFEKVPVPYIAHWHGNHFVVVYGLDRTAVKISDPATGTLRTLTKREFVTGWLGPNREPGGWKRGVILYLEKPLANGE